jgi:hypothetical protein
MLRSEVLGGRCAARPGEFAAEEFAASEKTRFDGAFGNAECAGGSGDILLVEIEEEDCIAVFGGKGEDGPA